MCLFFTVPQKPVAVAASVASSSEIHLTWNLPGPKPGITTYYIKVYEVVLNVQPTFVKGKNVTGRYFSYRFEKQPLQIKMSKPK